MAFDSGSYVHLAAPYSLGVSGSGAEFATSTGDVLEVSAFARGVFRIRVGARTRPDYGLVVGRAQSCRVEQADASTGDGASRSPDTWRFSVDDTALELGGSPLRFRLLVGGAVVLASITDARPDGQTRLPAFGKARHGAQWVASLALRSAEPVFGLGEKPGALDHRGQLLHSWLEPAHGDAAGSARDIPFAWSTGAGNGAWGVLAHTSGAVIHGIGHADWSHRTYALVVEDEALDLFLFAGAAPGDVLRAFIEVAGAAPALPPWSHGAWVSLPHEDPARAQHALATLRGCGLACDAALLALDASPVARFSTRDAEGTPAALEAIRALGVRIGMREAPHVPASSPLVPELAASGYLLRAGTGDPSLVEGVVAGEPAALVDFTSADVGTWWRDMHEIAFAQGADIIETLGGELVRNDVHAANRDSGVRLHNVYPLLFNRCAQAAIARFRPADPATGHAPVVCAGAGWTGSHRVPVACAGPAQCDWEGLAAGIRRALSWSITGGAHYAMRVPPAGADRELAIRWLEAALFASHVRIDCDDADVPWPCAADILPIARRWLAFRYRLLPYLHAAGQAAGTHGLPVLRAMPIAFPGTPLLRGYDTQFMVGDALLVVPIVQAGGAVEIALPPGTWFDLNSREGITGPRVVRYVAALDQFPVFGRGGHSLPLGRAVTHAGEIDAAAPITELWLFGRPRTSPDGFAQIARLEGNGRDVGVRVASGVAIERFGDAAEVPVETM